MVVGDPPNFVEKPQNLVGAPDAILLACQPLQSHGPSFRPLLNAWFLYLWALFWVSSSSESMEASATSKRRVSDVFFLFGGDMSTRTCRIQGMGRDIICPSTHRQVCVARICIARSKPSTSAINNLTTMAPNLAESTHILIHSMISSKLQGENDVKDEEIATIAKCSTRRGPGELWTEG